MSNEEKLTEIKIEKVSNTNESHGNLIWIKILLIFCAAGGYFSKSFFREMRENKVKPQVIETEADVKEQFKEAQQRQADLEARQNNRGRDILRSVREKNNIPEPPGSNGIDLKKPNSNVLPE